MSVYDGRLVRSWSTRVKEMKMSRYDDVVVVGCGLAGWLRRGISAPRVVTSCFSKGARVGGRTWSTDFAAVGARVDLGAEWVAPGVHLALTSELAAYGLDLVAADLSDAEDFNGRQLTPEGQAECDRVVRQCDADASRIDFAYPRWYAAVEDLDIPMVEYATRLTSSLEVREHLLANAFALMGGTSRNAARSIFSTSSRALAALRQRLSVRLPGSTAVPMLLRWRSPPIWGRW